MWKSTVSGSRLRKMVVDVYASTYSPRMFAERVSTYTSEFVQEVAVAALHARKSSSWDDVAGRLPQYTEAEKGE